jgi:hypothetical protein
VSWKCAESSVWIGRVQHQELPAGNPTALCVVGQDYGELSEETPEEEQPTAAAGVCFFPLALLTEGVFGDNSSRNQSVKGILQSTSVIHRNNNCELQDCPAWSPRSMSRHDAAVGQQHVGATSSWEITHFLIRRSLKKFIALVFLGWTEARLMMDHGDVHPRLTAREVPRCLNSSSIVGTA